MKRFTIVLAGLAMTIPAFAQEDQEPNRLLINNTSGSFTGYVIDRVSNITFARVEGDVKAEIEVKEVVDCDTAIMSVTRSESCVGFKLDVVPAVLASQYDDQGLISYINSRRNFSTYYQDFTDAELTGINLNFDSEYDIVTIGIDSYGVEDGVCRARIKTPPPVLVGDPRLETEVVDRQLYSFSVKFTPNDDVLEYFCVAGEKGSMESQFNMFAPMFGFTNMSQLIKKWGYKREGEQVVDWTNMNPNTEYEVYYVASDAEGNLAPWQKIETSTLALGGEGEALVSIELGDYVYADWEGEMKPSQFISFTPNDQTSCYRFNVVTADYYDSDAEGYKADLCSDPWMPMAYWFFYEPMETDYQIDPETECVAIAAGKNINGEWGSVTELRFTTPDHAEGELPEEAVAKTPARNGKIPTRINAKKSGDMPFDHTPGKLPVVRKATGIELH